MKSSNGYLRKKGGPSCTRSEGELIYVLSRSDFGLITVNLSISSDQHKSVVEPLKQVARRELLHGLVDEYRDVTEDVILLEGETHRDRPSVSISVTYPLWPCKDRLLSRVIFVSRLNQLGRNIFIQSYMTYGPFHQFP